MNHRFLLKSFFILIIPIFLATGCASDSASALEDARFALDRGDYDDAITSADEAIAADENLVEAYRIKASALFARSEVDFFEVVEGILDLETSTEETNFEEIADVLPSNGDESDLRDAIETLQSAPGIDGSDLDGVLADAAFDLGLMMAIESFSVGVYSSDTGNNVEGIVDDDRNNVQDDLVNFDNILVGSGIDVDNEFVNQVRRAYCILQGLSDEPGFTTNEYKAFVGCQFFTVPTEAEVVFDPTILAGVLECADLLEDAQSAEVEDCYDEDTTLE